MFDMLTSPYTHPLKKLIWMRMKASARAVYDTITGNPVSFTAYSEPWPLKQLSVAFSPVQDLHGYDSPWPAGGGKNLLDPAYLTDCPATNIYAVSGNDVTVNMSDGQSWSNLPVYSLKAGTYVFYRTNSTGAVQLRSSDDDYASTVMTISATAFSNTFTLANDGGVKFKVGINAGDDYPFSTKLMIVSGSTVPTSFSPYENVCPIGGWTGVNIWDTGVNLWDGEWEYGSISEPTGQNGGNNQSFWRSKNYIPFKGGESYYPYSPQRTGNFRQFYYDQDKNYLGYTGQAVNSVRDTSELSYASRIAYMRFRWGSAHVDDDEQFSINYPSTVTDYVPYDSDSAVYHVAFPALGVNQWDETWEEGALSWAGENVSATNKIRSKNYIPVKPQTQYYASTPANIQIFYYDSNKEFIEYAPSSLRNTIFTTPENCYYMRFYTYQSNSYPPPYNHNISINYPSSATTYEPFDNTIYSGWVDPTTGDGIATHKNLVFNGSESKWVFEQVVTGVYRVSYSLTDADKSQTGRTPIDCNMGKFAASGHDVGTVFLFKASSELSMIYYYPLADIKNLEEFKTWLSTNNLQIVYPLAEPIPFHVDPQSISPLEGDNTMWADVNGDLTVTYRSS